MSPRPVMSSSSCSSLAIPPPVPPSVNAGRTRTGYPPISGTAAFASSMLLTVLLLGMASLRSSMVFLKSSRSSDSAMARGWLPSSSTPSLSRAPVSASSEHRLRAVCPPIPDIIPWTLSFSIILIIVARSSGSTYTMSAISRSVWMVAGLEFTRMVVYPSSLRDLHAWDPEKSNSAACPMTMGPEPMTMILLISSLLGISRPPACP